MGSITDPFTTHWRYLHLLDLLKSTVGPQLGQNCVVSAAVAIMHVEKQHLREQQPWTLQESAQLCPVGEPYCQRARKGNAGKIPAADLSELSVTQKEVGTLIYNKDHFVPAHIRERKTEYLAYPKLHPFDFYFICFRFPDGSVGHLPALCISRDLQAPGLPLALKIPLQTIPREWHYY